MEEGDGKVVGEELWCTTPLYADEVGKFHKQEDK